MNDSNLVLPSIFNSNVARVAVPDQDFSAMSSNRFKEKQSESPSALGKSRNRRFNSVNMPDYDFVKSDLNTTVKLNDYCASILGPDAKNPETSVYFRKDLSYLDKLNP